MVHLPPKELAALRLLLANAGRIVTPLQLRQALWGDVHVTADSVPSAFLPCVPGSNPTMHSNRLQTRIQVHRLCPAPWRWAAGAVPRLAILPFSAGFGVPDYLGPVIAEETIARLGGARPSADFGARQGFGFHHGTTRFFAC